MAISREVLAYFHTAVLIPNFHAAEVQCSCTNDLLQKGKKKGLGAHFIEADIHLRNRNKTEGSGHFAL